MRTTNRVRALRLLACALGALGVAAVVRHAQAAPPAKIVVSDATGLAAALSRAPAGATVLLQGGDYGDVTLTAHRSDWVTVATVPGQPVTFDDLDFAS